MGLESSGVYQQSFTFLSVTLQPLGAYRSTIPHMKGHINSFNMRYNSMTCTKRLQRYSVWNCLIGPSLVCLYKATQVDIDIQLYPLLLATPWHWQARWVKPR